MKRIWYGDLMAILVHGETVILNAFAVEFQTLNTDI